MWSRRRDRREGSVDVTDLDGLLAFAARSRVPEGGFGHLGDDGALLDRPQET